MLPEFLGILRQAVAALYYASIMRISRTQWTEVRPIRHKRETRKTGCGADADAATYRAMPKRGQAILLHLPLPSPMSVETLPTTMEAAAGGETCR